MKCVHIRQTRFVQSAASHLLLTSSNIYDTFSLITCNRWTMPISDRQVLLLPAILLPHKYYCNLVLAHTVVSSPATDDPYLISYKTCMFALCCLQFYSDISIAFNNAGDPICTSQSWLNFLHNTLVFLYPSSNLLLQLYFLWTNGHPDIFFNQYVQGLVFLLMKNHHYFVILTHHNISYWFLCSNHHSAKDRLWISLPFLLLFF